MIDELPAEGEEQIPGGARFGKRKVYLLSSLLVVIVAGGFFGIRAINTATWQSRLASSTTSSPIKTDNGSWAYRINIETAPENSVQFASSIVSGSQHQFQVSSCDLLLGNNVLHYDVKRGEHSRSDSLTIENVYAPITLSTDQSTNNLFSTTELEVFTEPGNTLSFMDWDTLLADGYFSVSFDPDSVLEPYDPDLTPTLTLSERVTVTNSTGNERSLTEDLVFRFPRVELEISDPWNGYISRTGSSYTIKGYGDSGVRVTFSGAASGYTTIGSSGTFSKWVSVPDFGENYYFLVASEEGFTSDTVMVVIFREMTDDEIIQEYKRLCEHVTAEYLRLHQSSLVGHNVRVWGRTVEYFSGNQLHLVNGDDHWIADLSGFERIPNLVGLSCYCWGEVTSQNRSFRTSGGANVTAPIIDAMYYEVSY